MKNNLIFLLLFFNLSLIFAQENCNNGIDDDGDGLVDLNDASDCDCQGFTSTKQPSTVIPNTSFEDQSDCPTGDFQLHKADHWMAASAATADYLSTCGITSTGQFTPPSVADGMAYAGFFETTGNYKEYIGTCLTGNMTVGTLYEFHIKVLTDPTSAAMDLTMFGTSDCNNLPFGGSNFDIGCPMNVPGWVELGSVPITANSTQWVNYSFTFTPTQNIDAIIIGPPCAAATQFSYYYVDDISLFETPPSTTPPLTITADTLNTSLGVSIPNMDPCLADIQLTATTSATGTFQWYKDGIALVGETNTTYTVPFGNIGSYQVKLTNGSSCILSNTISITTPVFPIANFTSDIPCSPNAISFTDVSNVAGGSVTNWDWDFGDNQGASNIQHPSYTYNTTGNFNATLTVTGGPNGCRDDTTITIPINSISNAFDPGFIASPGCQNNNTSFTDTSLSNSAITNWNWDFGDNTTNSTIQNPSHIYTSGGNYTVSLTVTDASGCTASTSQTVAVSPNPVANFTFTNNCPNDTIKFLDNSTISSGQITNWNWNFGTGTSNNAAPSYTFGAPGTYNVSLSVTSDLGCVNSTMQIVEPFASPLADFSYVNGCIGDSTVFTDLSTISNGNITDWNWDFNSSINNPNSKHLFNSEGQHAVKLIVTSANNCMDDTVKIVDIYPKPIASFNADVVCDNEAPTSFIDNSNISSGNINGWLWRFGDGSISTMQTPNHAYNTSGAYNTTLTVVSDQGCIDSLQQTTHVLEAPEIDFSVDLTQGCVPLCVQFSNNSSISSGNIDTWIWEFGNGQTSDQHNPDICYESAGTYSINLIAIADNNCRDTLQKIDMIDAWQQPTAGFNALPSQTSILNPTITFNDQSTDASTWTWNFGDGNIDHLQYPQHTYADTGTYTVEQIVNTPQGCSDTVIHTVIVLADFKVFIPNTFTPNDDGINDVFQIYGSGFITSDYQINVFTRWGDIIYSSDDINQPWDGTDLRGKLAAQDTYVYKIEIYDFNNKKHIFFDHVNLIR